MEKTTNTHRGDQDSPAEAYTAFYTANVVVAGITGAGKSTLINAVFGHELAKTGTGRPITEQIAEYQSDDFPIRIWDTVGLELDNEKPRSPSTRSGRRLQARRIARIRWTTSMPSGIASIPSAAVTKAAK